MLVYLPEILEHHRQLAARDARSLNELVERARAMPPCRGFAEALAAGDRLAVIAEIKRRSPSKGPLAPNLDVAETARAYVAGGASCLSVLTDERFFGGSAADLELARQHVRVPVLRKDFTVSPHDVCDARLMGADAVLLIVAALSDTEIEAMVSLAVSLGLDALVEVHDEGELGRALDVGATLIGVNQRDLRTFEVDQARAVSLASQIPRHVVSVAESGITSVAEAARLASAGFDAVLIGEAVVRSGDCASAVSAFAHLPTTPSARASTLQSTTASKDGGPS